MIEAIVQLEKSVYDSPPLDYKLVFDGPGNRNILHIMFLIATKNNIYVESFNIRPLDGKVVGITAEGELSVTLSKEVYEILQSSLSFLQEEFNQGNFYTYDNIKDEYIELGGIKLSL